MRIISGTHKGRRISVPKNLPVRPTTDRSKEGLFNILQHRLEFESLTVLDLFSGTGNMSYEFASRGVSKITAVDQNRHCVNFIQKTAGNLELDINTIQSECITFLKTIFHKETHLTAYTTSSSYLPCLTLLLIEHINHSSFNKFFSSILHIRIYRQIIIII